MLNNLRNSAVTGGLIGLSLLTAPSIAEGDDSNPPAQPPAAAASPEPGAAPDEQKQPELPALPEDASPDQLKAYAQVLGELAKSNPAELAGALAELEPYTRSPVRPVPFGFIVRASQIGHLTSDLENLFIESVKQLDSNETETINQTCNNLTAILRLLRHDYPRRATVEGMLDSPAFKKALAVTPESPEIATARMLGLGEALAICNIGPSHDSLDGYTALVRSVHSEHGNAISHDNYRKAIDLALTGFLQQSTPTAGGLRSLKDLAALTRTICATDDPDTSTAHYLISAPARFIEAESTLRTSASLKGTPEEAQLIAELLGAYREGIQAFHKLPDSNTRERLRNSIFDCGGSLTHLGMENIDHFLDVLQMEYLDRMQNDHAGISEFIAAVRYVPPFNPELARNECQWGQYALSRILAANREYFVSGVDALQREVCEAPSLSAKQAALESALDITRWFGEIRDITFREMPYDFNHSYQEQIQQQITTGLHWIDSDLLTRQEEFLPEVLPLAVAPSPVAHRSDGKLARQQEWLLVQLERACWLEARFNADSMRELQTQIFERITSADSVDDRAGLYRLLKPAVYLEINADDTCTDVADFLRGRIPQESDPHALRLLASTLSVGLHLEDALYYSGAAPTRYIQSFGIDQVRPPRSEIIEFAFMQGLIDVERGKLNSSTFLTGRDSAGSSWQEVYYDLFAAASGDLEVSRSFLSGTGAATLPAEGSAEELDAIAQLRHNALLVMGYSELDQERVSYKSEIINFLERHLDTGTPRQWGQRSALLFELYDSDWLHAAPGNKGPYFDEKSKRLEQLLFGDALLELSRGAQSTDLRPAVDRYLDGHLLTRGVSPLELSLASFEQRKDLLDKHNLSVQIPRLEMADGFVNALHPASRRLGMEFLMNFGFTRATLEDPERLLEVLRQD